MDTNMKAELVLDQRYAVTEEAFVEIRIWRVPRPVRGSTPEFKYSLAYVVPEECVLRYDNEAGKGDHRHVGPTEKPYGFTTPEKLIADFWSDVDNWRPE
jgi:hypothetical protein